jgi:integrase
MAPPRRGRPAGRNANGEGSIYWDTHNDCWVGAITVGLADDGRPIRRKRRGATRAEVRAKLDALMDDAGVLDLITRTPTVAQLARQWGQARARSGAPASTASIRGERVERHIIGDPLIGNVRADSLRVDHVERWLLAKIAAGWEKPDGTRRPYSAKTIADMRGDLSQIVGWAVRRRLVAHNPVPLAELPPVAASAPKRTLSPEQAGALIRACATTDRRYGALVLTALLLGVRPGEAAALSWDAVDFDAGVIHVRAGLQRRSGGAPAGIGPTKTKQTRTLASSPLLLDALRLERKKQDELRAVAGPLWCPDWDGLVFLTETGRPPHASNLRRTLRSIADDAGIDLAGLTLYELRHSCASLLDDAGVPIGQIVDQLGHADDRMFWKHYRHRVDPVVTAAAGVLDRLAETTDA